MENPKSRNWNMILYPDDPTHQQCITVLAQNGYDHASILHDKDTWDENESPNHDKGEAKKPHWHIVLKVKNPRYRNAIADELGIAPNYLEPCRDLKKSLLYLIHDGFETKYQYDITDVNGPLKQQLETLLMCDNEGERVLEIVHMIDQSPGVCTYREILVKACKAGLWPDFRKLGTGVKFLLDEHNNEFLEIAKQRKDLTSDRIRRKEAVDRFLADPGNWPYYADCRAKDGGNLD